MTTAERFFEQLLQAAPILRSIHREHVEDNDGVRPQLLLGEITQWMIRAADNAANRPVLRQILRLVDAALAADERLSSLVAAYCVEPLCDAPEALAVLLPMMGEATRRQVTANSER